MSRALKVVCHQTFIPIGAEKRNWVVLIDEFTTYSQYEKKVRAALM